MPLVRLSVRGPKMMGAAQRSLSPRVQMSVAMDKRMRGLKNQVATNLRVPHISLVFREMWDTTAFDPRTFGPNVVAAPQGIRRVPQRTWACYVSLVADHSAFPYSPRATVPLIEFPAAVPLKAYSIAFPPTGMTLRKLTCCA